MILFRWKFVYASGLLVHFNLKGYTYFKDKQEVYAQA